jgi:hypothetical protein
MTETEFRLAVALAFGTWRYPPCKWWSDESDHPDNLLVEAAREVLVNGKTRQAVRLVAGKTSLTYRDADNRSVSFEIDAISKTGLRSMIDRIEREL